jgi:hypothetical protein
MLGRATPTLDAAAQRDTDETVANRRRCPGAVRRDA